MRSVLKRAEHDMSEDVISTTPIRSATPMPDPAFAPAPTKDSSKTTSTASWSDVSSVVSIGSSWQGTLKVEGSVRIDGKLTGEVEAVEMVFVAETAEVDAELRAATVVIAGRFKGKVQSRERLEIMPTGKVNADMTTKSLVVHDGAFVEGQIHMAEVTSTPNASSTSAIGKDPARDALLAKDKAVANGVDVLRAATRAS